MCDLKRHFISAYGIEKAKLYKWQEQAYHLSQEKLVEVGKISWKGECVTMAQKKKHKSWGYNNLQRRLVENQCIFFYILVTSSLACCTLSSWLSCEAHASFLFSRTEMWMGGSFLLFKSCAGWKTQTFRASAWQKKNGWKMKGFRLAHSRAEGSLWYHVREPTPLPSIAIGQWHFSGWRISQVHQFKISGPSSVGVLRILTTK